MQLKILKPKEPNAIAKLTVQRSGKLGFSKGALELLDLEANKFAKFGFDELENFYIVIYKESDEETFNISKAGDYYYINAKTLLEDLEIDYSSDDTTIFDIRRTDVENTFKLNKRVLKKSI